MSSANKNTDLPGLCSKCGRGVATLSMSGCPECGGPVVSSSRPKQLRGLGWLSLPPMRYQRSYAWFVLLSSLDIMLTWVVLQLSGQELNPVAASVINNFGLQGMVVFKFALVMLVVVMSEVIGRRNDRTGRKLAEWSVAVTAIPVILALIQLFR